MSFKKTFENLSFRSTRIIWFIKCFTSSHVYARF